MSIIYIIIGFILIILVNVYFRVKVLTHYKYLVRNEIDFNIGDIFNSKNLEMVVENKKKEHKDHILAFAKYLKIGVYLTSSIIILIVFLFLWMKK